MKDIFRGTLVRLAMDTPEVMAKGFARWAQDSEYHRLADSDPAKLWSEKSIREWIEKQMDQNPVRSYRFSIRTLAEDKFIGEVSLNPIWEHGDGWVGIVIGEREYWNKGYGTDAMRLIVQFGFVELNLHRITLGVHSYNPRARRVYEKIGFVYEGQMRGETLREGIRHDGVYMGILRREWQALQGDAK